MIKINERLFTDINNNTMMDKLLVFNATFDTLGNIIAVSFYRTEEIKSTRE